MIGISQNLRLGLEQRLTPQQILLSTLLQLPLLSLEQKIKSELEMNPVLEEGDEEDVATEETIDASAEEMETVDDELKIHDEANNASDEYDRQELNDAQNDTDIKELINDDETFEIRIPRDKNQEEYERPEISLKSLPEHLFEQLHILNLTESEFAIGEYLIWNIRDDGYLDQSLSLETTAQNFNTTVAEVEKTLKAIQRLDPTGVGSLNLRECLMVQLEENGQTQTIAYQILKDYFEDFKNKRYEKLIHELGITREILLEQIARIMKLNPKPGEGVFDTRNNYIVPDFIIEKVDDKFIISLNDWNIPPLRISSNYKRMLMDRNHTDKETRQYIRKKVESAKWFITSIYQRKMTMLKVMEAIIEKQHDFFNKGTEFIRPLIMREIADIIGMDISTVSRVSNGKYVQTDYGVFELKYFFNERIENEEGEEISTRRIKNKIKELVENEDHNNPLSDDQLAAVLKKASYPIARRTVAKYREQMQIPIARLRRKI
jgi:RNA polymerase sigma-54 factor